MTKKITCMWNLGMEHSGEIKYRTLVFRDDMSPLEVEICEACFNNHNRIIEIGNEYKCDPKKALEIFYEERETLEQELIK